MDYLKLYEGFQEVSFGNWVVSQYSRNERYAIETMNCSSKKLTTLKGIEDLMQIKILRCQYNNLTSLKGIETLLKLEFLDCSHNKLTSLELGDFSWEAFELGFDETDLRRFKKLKELHCGGNKFSEKYKTYIQKYCDKNGVLAIVY